MRNTHSVFAQNYLEERFIGFIENPKVLVPLSGYKGDLDDLNMSVASFKDIVSFLTASK
jgi:hypothetical protein